MAIISLKFALFDLEFEISLFVCKFMFEISLCFTQESSTLSSKFGFEFKEFGLLLVSRFLRAEFFGFAFVSFEISQFKAFGEFLRLNLRVVSSILFFIKNSTAFFA